MDSETRNALAQKADGWKVQDLENQIRQLKAERSTLTERTAALESRIAGLASSYNRFLQLLIETEHLPEHVSVLYDLFEN